MINSSFSRIAAAAVLGLAPAAALAGGYVAPVVPAPIIAPEVQAAPAWAGAYAGLGLGYAFGTDDVVGISDPADVLLGSPGSVDIKGVTYGLHLGYRWQTEVRGRQVVFGPELGFEKGSVDAAFDAGSASASNELDNLLALRMKTGVVNAAGNTLFYGIAGVGRGEFNYAVNGNGMSYDGSYKDNAWILGLGAERKLTDRVSIFGEWEYRGFGKTMLTDAGGFTTEATPAHHHVKLGVNFSF